MEIFNQPVEVRDWYGSGGLKMAGFEIGDEFFNVTAARMSNQFQPKLMNGYYHISFGVYREDEDGNDYIDIDKTGSGNEYQVFGHVIQLLRNFMNQNPILPFEMTANGQNRADLYVKLAKKLLPSWTAETNKRHNVPDGYTIILYPPSTD